MREYILSKLSYASSKLHETSEQERINTHKSWFHAITQAETRIHIKHGGARGRTCHAHQHDAYTQTPPLPHAMTLHNAASIHTLDAAKLTHLAHKRKAKASLRQAPTERESLARA